LIYKGKYYRAQGYTVPTYNVEAKIDLKAEEKNLAVQYSVINAIAAEKKTVSHSVNIFLLLNATFGSTKKKKCMTI
jgi:hypothetical protein